jgi:hypothetical protein
MVAELPLEAGALVCTGHLFAFAAPGVRATTYHALRHCARGEVGACWTFR